MIQLKNITIQSGDFQLRNLTAEFGMGEYVVLTGKSGSGKTTVLEAICGLRELRQGEIWLQGIDVSQKTPSERQIGFVPQDTALFDQMSVFDQIGFALKLRQVSSDEIVRRVEELAEQMQILSLLDRFPSGLSGGEQKRVALARALSAKPRILCLDEPLSALDDETRYEIIALLQSLKGTLTVLHVTHNRYEVEQLADRCVLLQDGQFKSVDHYEPLS